MLLVSDDLPPQEIESEVKAYAREHSLTHLWWGGLREALYNYPNGYLACKYRPGAGNSPFLLKIEHFQTRDEAKALFEDDPDNVGNIIIPVDELEWAKYSFDVWSSDAGSRLRLFEAGNNACPICLKMFSKNDVEDGASVVLARIPLTAFTMDESVEACLTCSDCGSRGVEPAVASQLLRTRAQLEVGGAVLQADMKIDEDGTINARIREHQDTARARAHREAMSKGEDMTISFTAPRDPRAAMVTWLKLSYLSLFSLLGVHGYRYARGAAVERVREQIMRPDEEIIRHFTVKCEEAEVSGILMNHDSIQCWAVIMSGVAVLLPRGWDTSFYDRIDDNWVTKGTLGGGPLWFPAKFGSVVSGSIQFKEGYDPSQAVGGKDRLFGLRGRAEGEGRVSEFIVADWSGQDVTTLSVGGLS